MSDATKPSTAEAMADEEIANRLRQVVGDCNHLAGLLFKRGVQVEYEVAETSYGTMGPDTAPLSLSHLSVSIRKEL